MSAAVEAALLELRRSRPYWGPRRLVFELAKRSRHFFSSGAGFMTITTDNTMLVSFPLPNCVQLGGATAEQSNAFYSLLPNSVNTSFTQAFQPLTAL
jgi:hypothetical protein